MGGIALQEGEISRDPFRPSFAVGAGDDAFMPHIISDVRKVNLAAAVVGLLKQDGNIRTLHKP